jgi:hypothetical protein|tara:strand:- start:2290 stop:2583 length:294 start_codon:yes stop_codon:yes gene_type:complete
MKRGLIISHFRVHRCPRSLGKAEKDPSDPRLLFHRALSASLVVVWKANAPTPLGQPASHRVETRLLCISTVRLTENSVMLEVDCEAAGFKMTTMVAM